MKDKYKTKEMEDSTRFRKRLVLLYRYTVVVIVCWALIVGVSLIWNIHQKKESTESMAKNEALSSFKRDEAIRLFIVSRGGVYVPLDDKTPSNPYLNHPERDITTTSGKNLTLMNVTYFFRKVIEEYGQVTGGVNWRVTSLKPTNSANIPDEWEQKTLRAFEKQAKVMIGFSDIKGEPYLRLLSPMVTVESCLKCHAYQGYKVGEIRGAVGVSLPMAPYLMEQRKAIRYLIWTHVIFMLSGIVGIVFASSNFRTRIIENIQAEEALRDSEKRHRMTLISVGDAVIATDAEGRVELLNPVAEALTGWSEAEALGKPLEQVFRIINEETRDAVENPVERVLREGLVVGLANHSLLIAKDGREIPIADSGAPIRNEQGAIIGVVLVFRDQAAERAAQRALLESESKFKRLYDSNTIGIIFWDTAGNITQANSEFLRIVDYTEEDVLSGKVHWKDMTPPEYAPLDEKALKEMAETGVSAPFEKEYLRKDGSRVPVVIGAALFKGQKDVGICFVQDISERKLAEMASKRAEEELRKHRDELEQLVEQRTEQLADSRQRLSKESAAVATIVAEMLSGHLTDAETERQVLNACLDATKSLYGMIGVINKHGKYDVTTYNSRTLSDCAFSEALAWELSTGMDIRGIWGWPMLHGKPLLCNNLQDHPDRVGQPEGHVPIESFLGVPIKREDKVFGMVAVSNKPGGYTDADVETLTRLVDVMAVSRQYRALLTEMEQLVHERTAQLEAANKELGAFSYSVSHDLRTPLRAIDGFSHVLLEDYYDKLDDEGKRFLNIIKHNTQSMGKLIDDLLALSHFSRQGIGISYIDIEKLARTAFEELKATASERTVLLDIKTLPPAKGDQSMIRQVFTNLLSNAIKFTRPKETAIIEVGGSTEKNENIYYVKDNGVGFDMQYVHKLFNAFQRLHSTAEFEGTGVGLAIVQRIINRHGGRVWAEGKINEGATFYFSLPRIDYTDNKK